ncbi:hypothetical protein [Bacillus solimangrovi]|nr:hypothetical protein [Bacillus solimangrovi]
MGRGKAFNNKRQNHEQQPSKVAKMAQPNDSEGGRPVNEYKK